MFLKDSDEAIVRMGAEITFLRQVIEAQKQETEQLKKDKANANVEQGKATLNGEGGKEAPSV